MKDPETINAAETSQQDPVAATAAPAGTSGDRADSTPKPDRDEIARLAYSYWEARGRDGGCPDDDWLRAERELRASQ